MEKFNLDKYLANPSRKVVTRDGRSVSILGIDSRPSYPWPVKSTIGDKVNLTYSCDGRVFNHRESTLDLFFATEVKEKWVNLYKLYGNYYLDDTLYDSKEEAEKVSESSFYVATVKVVWEESSDTE